MRVKVPLWLFASLGIGIVLWLSWYVTDSFDQSAQYEDAAYTGLYIDTTKPPTLLSSSEQKTIDAWIKKNKLNKFGDTSTTAYATSPLKTADGKSKYTSRFEYILAKHPDKPWKNVAPPTADEKVAIDAWILQNGLNTYGDAIDTAYAGGSPLVSEGTGVTLDRYQYIVSKHPEKPWNAITPASVN